MKVIVALSLAATAAAACESLAPAAPDPSRPSLFPGSSPSSRAPAVPATQARQDDWMPLARTDRGADLGAPYPSQRDVLNQQRSLLNQDIRQQEVSRDRLQQQLQQGTERDQQEVLRLQQQLERDRAAR